MEYFKKYIYRRGFIFTKCHQFLSASKGMNGEGNGTPLQCSCLENPKDGGAWWAAVHGVAKSRIGLSDFTFTFHFHTLEKEMATHSSILAWRIPGMREPGGLPSMGSHRVGHDWSDLAAAKGWNSSIITEQNVWQLKQKTWTYWNTKSAHTHFSIRAYAHSTLHLTWSWRQFKTCLFVTPNVPGQWICTAFRCHQLCQGISDPAAVTSASGASTLSPGPPPPRLRTSRWWRGCDPHTRRERALVSNSLPVTPI